MSYICERSCNDSKLTLSPFVLSGSNSVILFVKINLVNICVYLTVFLCQSGFKKK